MSYYNPVVEVGPRPRPGAVSAAGYLLYGVTALSIIAAGVYFAQLSSAGDIARRVAGPGDDPEALATGARIGVGGVGAICLLAAVMFAICAAYNLRGRNGMRITTWAVGGLFALCLGCSAVGSGIGAAVGSTTTTTTTGISSSSQAVVNSFPAWYRVSISILEVVSVVLLLVTIILLGMPASNAYFRKPSPMLMAMPGGYQMPAYPPLYPPPGQMPYPPPGQMPYPPPPVPGQYLPPPAGAVPADPPTAADPNWPGQR